MNNVDLQNEEILALRSIYDGKELIIEEETPPKGRFDANVQLPSNFYIHCGGEKVSKHPGNYKIEYLPPINLFFEFPETYPSSTCPAFLLSCSWLTLKQLSDLCKKLESMWRENVGEVVLFRWIDFLVNEVLNFFKIVDTLDITKLVSFKSSQFYGICHSQLSSCENDEAKQCPAEAESSSKQDKVQDLYIKPRVHGGCKSYDCRAFLDLTNGALLAAVLLKYDKNKRNEAFCNDWVICDICFCSKKGSEFMRFNKCDHLHCKECLKSYFEVQIRDGNVHALNCPTEKCESQAEAQEVKQLVSVELFQKYDALLLSRTLDGMDDIVYCPRKLCQTPLITDPDGNMGCCPTCHFVFCLFCRMAYHGVAPCNIKFSERKALCLQYLEGDTEEKVRLEKKYGKREIQLIVNDCLSEEWMNSNGKKCPHCQTMIEKSDGCNKMTCFKCGTYFCWLCMQRLSQTNPYSHYSDNAVPCFNQLFPDEELDFEPGEFLEF